MDWQEKKNKLNKMLGDFCREDVCIAFSGGVDSSLLLYLLGKLSKERDTRVYAVTFDTELHPAGDLEIAREIAQSTETIHHVIHLDELENPEILENPPDRCYLCKKMLFERLLHFACEKNVEYILEGTNLDDRSIYRPGLRAVAELGIKSPLAECGFTKAEVRRYAGECGLSVSRRPSTPCLATRLPYHTHITREVLSKIEQGETYLRKQGFYNVRMRVHGDVIRLELDSRDLPKALEQSREITEKIKKLGFSYVTLDLEGFRSGSMDEIF